MAAKRVAAAPKDVRQALARMLSLPQAEDQSNKLRAGDDRSGKLRLPDNWGTPENVRLFLKEFPDLDLYGEELLLRIFERLQEQEVRQAIFANPNLPFLHYAQGSRTPFAHNFESTYDHNLDWLATTNLDWLFWSCNVMAPSYLGELGSTPDFLTRLLTNAMVDMDLFSPETADLAVARHREMFPHYHQRDTPSSNKGRADLLANAIMSFFLLDESGTGHAILRSSPAGLLNPADRQIQQNVRNGGSAALSSGTFVWMRDSLQNHLLAMHNVRAKNRLTSIERGSVAWLTVKQYDGPSGHLVELMKTYLGSQGYSIGAVVEELVLLRQIQQGLGLPEFRTPLDAIL